MTPSFTGFRSTNRHTLRRCARGWNASLVRVVDQHHVGFAVPADGGELFAVVRVIEIADEFRFEVGELLAGRTIQMLQPEIVGLAVTNGVNDASAVPLEQDRAIAT